MLNFTTLCPVLLTVLVASAECYRVLVAFPLPGKSHGLLGEGYVRLLLRTGHEVTYLTPFPVKTRSKNLTQIIVGMDKSLNAAYIDRMNLSSLLTRKSVLTNPFALLFAGVDIAGVGMNSTSVKNFLEDPNQKFDLVVAEWFFTELLAGLAALYECPLVWSSSMGVHTMILGLMDETPNPAYTPDIMSYSRPPFSFVQRAQELWMLIRKLSLNEFLVIPKAAGMYKNLFGTAASKRGIVLPPYEEVIYNASLMLLNSHPSLGDAPKLPQNAKEIGGYHIEEPEQLPEDLQKIMDSATEGVIYFSLGSNMKSADMPEEMKREMLEMFGQLKETVFWKIEEEFKQVPPNVHVRSWMPQHSILAHPNTRLFVTHGGMLSTTETVHFGVPVVVIPLFGDQFLNADMAVRRGIAVRVHFTYEIPNDLHAAIREAIDNPSYSRHVRQLSRTYHDRPLSPAAELVYWLEYAVRTGGAPHLRSAALLLPWYRRLYLDLLALIVCTLILALLLRTMVQKLFRKSKPQEKKNKIN